MYLYKPKQMGQQLVHRAKPKPEANDRSSLIQRACMLSEVMLRQMHENWVNTSYA